MIDLRNPSGGFKSLRARINVLGPPAESDRGANGAPLAAGEWVLLIGDMVAHPRGKTEPLWNMAMPGEDGRDHDANFVGGGASGWFGSGYLRARSGIRANAARPGMVYTPLTSWRLDQPDLRALVERAIPLDRAGLPEEFADAVSVLASGRLAYLTGNPLVLDRGMSALWQASCDN